MLGTFEILVSELGKALLPLRRALASPESFFAFMLKLGWHADEIPQPLQDLVSSLDALFADLRKLFGGGFNVDGSVDLGTDGTGASFSAEDLAGMAQALQRVITAIREIASAPDASFPAQLLADGFKQKFPKQLINYLIVEYLRTYHGSVAFASRALGITKMRYVAPAGGRLPYVDYSLDLSDLPSVLTDPKVVLENAFGWGQVDFDYEALISQIDNLFMSIGVDVFIEEMPKDVAARIEGGVDIPDDPVRKVLKGVFFQRMRSTGRMAAEVRLLYLPANGPLKAGIALMPAFNGLLDIKMQAGPDITVAIRSDLDLQGGVALQVRPEQPIQMIIGFNRPGSPVSATGTIEARVERTGSDVPRLLFGSQDGTRLQYQKLGGIGGVRFDANSGIDAYAEVDLNGLEFILKLGDADSFISTIFPADGVEFGSNLAVGLSYHDGFYFRGTSHLEISAPVHVTLGPIDIQSLTIAANPASGALPISLGVTATGSLGPLSATVENMGITAQFTFPPSGGNLGFADLTIGFKPPNGVGLSVDAGVVKGGGFLYIDTDRGQYAGALQLVIADFLNVTAIGLIETKMPDGSKGFSLLIIITADFGPGIQLGFGFTLLAVGGLVGLNRGMLFQPIMDGVRTNAIASVMFPQDVIANAPRIISDLQAFFPPQQGTFLIGPMAKLGWGEPTLVSLSLGVIIEIPPGDIAILGILKLALPAEELPILVLQVNFAGAIEVDKQRIYFFASLFDSHILFITIDGGMGLLFAYGDDANFVVSVGGFHPQFNPPPLPFPALQRISVNIINESYARIHCDGYFAVTTNTVQFGTHSDYFFGFSALSVEGASGFDALIQFSPFHFTVSISTSFSVHVFGVGVYGVGIALTLEGPTPWHANGTASLSFLFFSVDIGIDFTWGDSRDTTLPPIAVMPILVGEIGKQSNWRAIPPTGSNLLVTLRRLDPSEAGFVLHPLGTLQVNQRQVPLDLTLDKFGNQKPTDADRFALSVTSPGLGKIRDLTDSFAPAQFKNMDDAAKLSQHAYVPNDSGIELAVAGMTYASATAVTRMVRYDLTIIDTKLRFSFLKFFIFAGGLFQHFLRGNSAARSALSAYRNAQTHPFSGAVTVAPETFAVALKSNNSVFRSEAAAFTSQVAANDYVARAVGGDPTLAGTLHVLPQFELAA